MKKLLPLIAATLLLASCGGASSPSSQSQPSEPASEPETSITSDAYAAQMTFLQDGEMYLDFNFKTRPAGFSVKINGNEVTESSKIKMSKDFTFEITCEYEGTINIYRINEINGTGVSAGGASNQEAAKAKDFLDKLFKNVSERQYEYRFYICFSDQDKGWSKSLAGVDSILQNYYQTQE